MTFERFMRHEPVSARRASLSYRMGKLVRRYRAGVAAAGVVAASLIAATTVSVMQMREARRQRDAAIESKRRADAEGEFQSLLMSQVGEKPISMREILDRGRVVLERRYGSDPPFLSAMLLDLATDYGKLGNTDVVDTLLARAESLAVASAHPELIARIRCFGVENQRSEGEYARAHLILASADSLRRAIPDPSTEVSCLQAAADLDVEAGDGTQAILDMRRALAILDSLGQRGDMEYTNILSTWGGALDRQGAHREAADKYRRALFLLDSAGESQTVDRAIIEHNYGLALGDLGETTRAEELLHDVLLRIEKSDPTAHSDPQPLIHYGQAAYDGWNLDSAGKYFAVLAAQATADHNKYWQGRALFGLAQSELRSGKVEAAKRTVERFRAIADNPRLRGTDDHIVDVRILDARLALAARDWPRAYALVTSTLHARDGGKGLRRPVFREALLLASEAALGAHAPASALKFAQDARAISTLDSLSATTSARVGEAWLAEGRALLARGDSTAGSAALDHARVALRTGAGPAHPLTREADSLLTALPH